MRFGAVVAGAILITLAGCKGPPPTGTATLVEVNASSIVVEVTTKPGVHVSMSYSNPGTEVGADGHARVEIERREWRGWYGSDVEVVAKASGNTAVLKASLPVPIAVLSRIPDSQPIYLAYLGGEPIAPSACKGEDRVGLAVDGIAPVKGAEGRDEWCSTSARRSVFVAVPPGAHVEIGGGAADAPTGIFGVDLTDDVLVRSVVMATLGDKTPTIELPAKVTTKSGSSDTPLRLRAKSWHDVPTWLTRRLDRIATEPLAGSTPTVETVVVRDTSGMVSRIGADGPLGATRWIAIERGTKRVGCVLHDYEDVETTIHDARTGAKLGSRSFRAPDVACEGYYVKGAPKDVYGPDPATVTAWIRGGMKSGTWK